MSADKFCLKWNDFETNISVAFKEIREEKDFFDVTLACDDSQIQAHKVILSACSPFFRTVLRRNPHQHPLLYLKGVKYQELISVLNFMYNGEVNVAQEELNTFLAVAEDLRVKGLTQNNGAGTEKKASPPPPQDSSKQIPRPREPPERDPLPQQQQPKRPRPPAPPAVQVNNPVKSYHNIQQYEEDIEEVVPVKSEPRDPLPPQQEYGHHGQEMVVEHGGIQDSVDQGAVALDQGYAEDGYGYDDYGGGYDNTAMMNAAAMAGDETNKDILLRDKMWKNLDGLWQCSDCGYTSNKTSNLRNHIEVNHTASQGYYCQECNKFCRSKNSLNIHKSRYKH